MFHARTHAQHEHRCSARLTHNGLELTGSEPHATLYHPATSKLRLTVRCSDELGAIGQDLAHCLTEGFKSRSDHHEAVFGHADCRDHVDSPILPCLLHAKDEEPPPPFPPNAK